MQSDEQTDLPHPHTIHSELTFFPTYRHALTIVLLCLLQAHGIYICLPLSKNSNMSFLIGQIFLLVIIFYSWYTVLNTTPGPMSQLFNEEFVKKTIDQALQQETQTTEHKICTKCQMETLAKLHHCEQCNRCVYKHFFHSRWFNTCIAKEKFPQFTAFLVFLEIYLILLEIDNAIFFVQLRNKSQDTFGDFFVANLQNALVSSFLFIVSFLVLAIVSMIAGSFFMAQRVKGSVEPDSCCRKGCHGLNRKSTNDKILIKLRQSVRQSNLFAFNQLQSSSESSNRNIFRETQDFTAKELNVKSIKKSFMLQSMSKSRQKQKRQQQQCSIDNFQGPYFKTDFFTSAKIFRKKQNSIEKKKRISRLSGIQEDISNMTASKWKKYVQSTFEKDSYAKRKSELASDVSNKPEQNDTPAEMLEKIENFQPKLLFQQNKENISDFIMKNSSVGKRKLISKFSRNDVQEDKENISSPNLKKLRFLKKSSTNNLASIFEKQEKLQDA